MTTINIKEVLNEVELEIAERLGKRDAEKEWEKKYGANARRKNKGKSQKSTR